MKPRILDLFCGAGGAAKGYADAGFEVIGVDIDPQPHYPFEFIQADALSILRGMAYMPSFSGEMWRPGYFAAVHASPPCQTHSALTKGNRGRPGWSDSHTDLIAPTRELLKVIGLPFVIENVLGSTVRRDVTLCGLMFGLKVFRHRYFEVEGFHAVAPEHPTHRGHRVAGWRHGIRHDGDMVAVYGDGGGKGSAADWQAAMGIDWTADKYGLAQAIPPAFTRNLGAQLMSALAVKS